MKGKRSFVLVDPTHWFDGISLEPEAGSYLGEKTWSSCDYSGGNPRFFSWLNFVGSSLNLLKHQNHRLGRYLGTVGHSMKNAFSLERNIFFNFQGSNNEYSSWEKPRPLRPQKSQGYLPKCGPETPNEVKEWFKKQIRRPIVIENVTEPVRKLSSKLLIAG